MLFCHCFKPEPKDQGYRWNMYMVYKSLEGKWITPNSNLPSLDPLLFIPAALHKDAHRLESFWYLKCAYSYLLTFCYCYICL